MDKQLKLGLTGLLIAGVLLFSSRAMTTHNILQAQEAPEEAVASEPTAVTLEAGNITVDFKDADIRDVLKIISYKSGVNIVSGKEVEGTVTIRLVNVPWEQALEVILKTYGFVYEREGDIIRVTTLENLSKEELATELFVLNYANAEEVSKAISEILTSRGKIKFDIRTNQLVVTDVPTNLYKISKVVRRLDKKTAQVLIEAKVIETVLDKDENLGINWTLQMQASGAARPLVAPFSFEKTYGKTGQEYFPKVDTTTGSFRESVGNGFPFATSTNFTFGTLSFTQLQAALEILKSRSDTKTLSNPRIVTLNNKEASIHVGEDYAVPTYERNANTGQMQVTGYELRKIGIKLTVTPHINAEDEIVVDLHPEVSAYLNNQAYGDITVPIFSVREALTQIMVKDAETIVIGGLIKDQKVDYVKKIPILGDIPLLKYIFSKTEKDVDTTDVIIFVTVKLLDSQGQELAQQPKVNAAPEEPQE